jgi:serine/threonine protein phosphatase PrpC
VNVPTSPWPNVLWERTVLDKALHPSLPCVLESFAEEGHEYLIEEALGGMPLWDAWDAPTATFEQRFGWLQQIAEALRALHSAGALLEGLCPDMLAVSPAGQAVLTDLADLLPVPLPADPPIRATLYTAPELVLSSATADARADLYSFGATLYSLYVGRELAETDFEFPGTPKPFVPRFPDAHPLLARLVSKTFCRDLSVRFPSEEAGREEITGFDELIHTLEVCRRTLDNVHLEIAAWATTGMVRTGNEDAFALMHAMDARQDDLGEYGLVLLADGMGGSEAGEVAAALAVQTLRENLIRQPPFAALAGEPAFAPRIFDLDACKQALGEALHQANTRVYTAAQTPGVGKRGMGCTAEAVYVDGRHVVVGHVGDSRTYHLHQGVLRQLTRDHTLVARLVELGQLTPEEALTHPRRSELQQALGGQFSIVPEFSHGLLKPGDWVVVCSDGLSNHVPPETLKEMLQTATSAEAAARRLVNLVNFGGATDNATVVVVRAT